MQEVSWVRVPSPPPISRHFEQIWRSIGFALAGVVAGEGSFLVGPQGKNFPDGTPRLRFRFQVTMASRDHNLLAALQAFLGVGSLQRRAPARAHWQPTTTLAVNSHRAHRTVTIPFAETFLLPCAKRVQYEAWKRAFVDYELAHPNRHGQGRSTCSIAGCERPVRGRGLCRSHYYSATGY
jgi:hypothetical protein